MNTMEKETITISPKAIGLRDEKNFEIFKHNGMLCCVMRLGWSGHLNGYVAVSKEHPLFGKEYSEKIEVKESPKFNGNYIGLMVTLCDTDRKEDAYSIDMAFNVHGGITYSSPSLYGIDKDIFDDLWWFGFDTAHAGDLRPFQSHIDRNYQNTGEEYRNFDYVKEETKKLADQLSAFPQ